MAKFQIGTEFNDPKFGMSQVVRYRDGYYTCFPKDDQSIFFIRTGDTISKTIKEETEMEVKGFSLETLSDAELSTLLLNAQTEQEKRQSVKEKEVWGKVVQAFKDYLVNYGGITVNTDHGEYYIEDISCLNALGEIAVV